MSGSQCSVQGPLVKLISSLSQPEICCVVSFLGLLVGAALLFLQLFSQPCGFSLAQSHLPGPTWQAGVLRTCLVLQGMVFCLERASCCRVWSKTEAENPTKVSPALTSLTWLGLSPPEGPPSTLALPASHSHFSPRGGWQRSCIHKSSLWIRGEEQMTQRHRVASADPRV